MKYILTLLYLLLSLNTSGQGLLDHPEEVQRLLAYDGTYPYFDGKDVRLTPKQFNLLSRIVDEGVGIKLKFNLMDSIRRSYEDQNSSLISAVNLGAKSIDNLVQTNQAISNIAMENYTKNTEYYGSMDRNYSELTQQFAQDKKDAKKWKKRAVTIGLIAILEALIIGISLSR